MWEREGYIRIIIKDVVLCHFQEKPFVRPFCYTNGNSGAVNWGLTIHYTGGSQMG